jgi:DNA-damage-inducible protein D
MNGDLPERSEYRHAMRRLEAMRRQAPSGSEYWLAREVQQALGYATWENFEGVVARAGTSLEQNGIEPSHHIAETTKMVAIGSEARRVVRDYFLSRAACYLIAMNGDPAKPEIAAAQAYFAVRARASELAEERSEDEKRLELRAKVTKSFKAVSGVAKEAGVPSQKQAFFHDARYQGLYDMSGRELKSFKGIDHKENIFDRMGALELSANDFQMNLAAETIKDEDVKGEVKAIAKNKAIAQRVRRTMLDSGSAPPERLPSAEPIKQVARRLKAQKKITKNPNA